MGVEVWFVLSLLCAMSLSVSDLLSKIALRQADIYLVSWAKVFFSFLFLLGCIFFIRIPTINPRFWTLCIFLFPLEVLALLLYMKAIQISPLSLTVPFLSLTPLFLILTSYLMLNEHLDISGILGVILIVIGAYLLNIKQATSGLLRPVKAIFYEKGSWLMIIVAAIFSITANLGKMAIQDTSPVFFAIIHSGITTVLVLPFPLILSNNPIRQMKDQIGIFIGIGAAMALMALFHMLAVIRIEVAYMISIKRTSPIFSVLLGYLYLHEGDFAERIAGTTVMFLGALFIIL